jgi:hypothetical protein
MNTYGEPTKWSRSEMELDQTTYELRREVEKLYAGFAASVRRDSQFYYSEVGDPSMVVEVTETRDSAVQICVQRNLHPRGGMRYTVSVKVLGRSPGVGGLVTKSEREFNARNTGEIVKKLR